MALKHTLQILTTAATVAFSGAALADSVFLLQLGSFDNADDGRARWAQLQDKYPQLLDGLQVQLKDVTLPPDDFTVYRTQAGVLTNRSDAQIICDRLSSRGDECYVVETAMFTPQHVSSPVAQSAEAVSAPVQDAVLQAQQTADMVTESFTPQEPLDLSDTPQWQNVQQAETALQDYTPPTPSATLNVPPTIAMPAAPSASVTTVQEEESFWSMLNPFSSDDEAEVAYEAPQSIASAQPVEWMDDAAAAPAQIQRVDDISFEEFDARLQDQPTVSATVAAPSVPMPEVTQWIPVEPEPIQPQALTTRAPETAPQKVPALITPPVQASTVTASAAPIETMPAGVPESMSQPEPAFRLPPPPRPDGQAMQEVLERRSMAEQRITATPPAVFATGADVKVAEAVRVPVTQAQEPVPLISLPKQVRIDMATSEQLTALGRPSVELREHGMWAQISYFDTQQDALAFWDGFRAENPTFPPVRVRITNPYMNPGNTMPRVSLRVGPFEHVEYASDICDEVRDDEIYCKLVNDLGGSTVARASRATGVVQRQTNYFLSEALATEPMYWVQVGAYPSPEAAKTAWSIIQEQHQPVLNNVQPNIAAPRVSSGSQDVFRLRAGPYAMRPGADALCQNMRSRGTKCMTVFSR